MRPIQDLAIKEEINSEENYILIEDDIKIEETCLQGDSNIISPTSVIIEQKFPICSICKCAFERKTNVRLQNESDLFKCYKCILHSKLSSVFSRKTQKRTKKKKYYFEENCNNGGNEVVILESNIEQSILIKKLMYVCLTCKKQFERKGPKGLRESSDWYNCNKCILHSRLRTAFGPGKFTQRKQNLVK